MSEYSECQKRSADDRFRVDDLGTHEGAQEDTHEAERCVLILPAIARPGNHREEARFKNHGRSPARSTI